MRYLKSYQIFSESLVFDVLHNKVNLLESLVIWHNALLDSISAEKLDIFDTLKLPKEEFSENLDIDYLSNSVEFINSLTSMKLKKGVVENTDDYETFIDKPCKWMFIQGIESVGDLETMPNSTVNPIYLLFQTWNDSTSNWSDVELYRVNDDVNKFLSSLTSREIEIMDGNVSYRYKTSNANEWELVDKSLKNDIYQDVFRREELEKLIGDRDVKVTIISNND